jgi:hypothetical protein
MIAHDAKVINGKRELFFRPFDEGKEEGTHGSFVENHLPAIDTRRDVIDGVRFKMSIVSHTLYRARIVKMLYCIKEENEEIPHALAFLFH